MHEPGWNANDGVALHSRIAFRSAEDQFGTRRRDARDLTLIVGLAMLAPLTLFSLAVGVAPAISCVLAMATVAIAATASRVLQTEYGVVRQRGRASRFSTAMLRIIPARHKALTVSKVRAISSSSGRRAR